VPKVGTTEPFAAFKLKKVLKEETPIAFGRSDRLDPVSTRKRNKLGGE
jgi:hypothetical protein